MLIHGEKYSVDILNNLNIIVIVVNFDYFYRAILKGLTENNVLSEVELNISNNEVSWLLYIWLNVLINFICPLF